MNRYRILLVDADPDSLEKFANMLEEAGHTVLPVSSLEEAEEALFVLKVDVAVLGSPFADRETAIFVDRLRGIENTQRNAVRAPVLAVSPNAITPGGWTLGDGPLDGYLTDFFNSEILIAAVEGTSLTGARAPIDAKETSLADLPIFEPEKFRQQVAYDPDLTVEIIDLFLEERSLEIPEMQAAIEGNDFERLSELAHTIKGSLSSLHAGLARHHAQELESSAKNQDEKLCRQMLDTLAGNLDALEPLLLKLRDEVKR